MRVTFSALVIAAGLAGFGGAVQAAPTTAAGLGASAGSSGIVQVAMTKRQMMMQKRMMMKRKMMMRKKMMMKKKKMM